MKESKLLTCPNCNSMSVLTANHIDFVFKCDCKINIYVYHYINELCRIGKIEENNLIMNIYTDLNRNTLYCMLDNIFYKMDFEIFNFNEINDALLAKYFKIFKKIKDNLLFY